MKVSFRSTSVSASPSPGTLITDFRLKANRNENEKLETNNTERRLDDMGYVTESYDAVRQLKQERTDILKVSLLTELFPSHRTDHPLKPCYSNFVSHVNISTNHKSLRIS